MKNTVFPYVFIFRGLFFLPHVPAGTTQNENEEFWAELTEATFMLHRLLALQILF
jgi:hypothetical protein